MPLAWLWLAWAPLAAAHDCVLPKLELKVGETRTGVTAVIADHHEETSDYFVVDAYDNTVAVIAPHEQHVFNATYTFQGLKAGSTVIGINWAYVPLAGEGTCATEVTVVEGQSTASTPGSGSDADPVDTFSGELFFHEQRPDLALGGPLPLQFQRYYGAYLRRGFVLGDLGNNWRHNFDATLRWNGTRAVYTSADGKVVLFDRSGDAWIQQDQLDVPYQLLTGPGVDARLYDPHARRIYHFDYTQGGATLGKLVRVEDGRGNAHDVTYDGNGRLQSIGDGLGRTLTFTYNGDFIPKIASIGDGTRTVQYLYQDAVDEESLTHVIDARGNTTVYSYADTSGTADRALLLGRQRPEGNVPYSQTYYGTDDQFVSGRVATQSDALGNTTTFTYDTDNRVTTIADPGATNRQHTHDAAAQLLTHRDEADRVIELGYDAQGRRASFTDREEHATGTTFNAASGRLASVSHPDGTTTGYTYGTRSVDGFSIPVLERIDYPDGAFETLAYDAVGNALTRVTRRGVTWIWTYNARGQPLTATNGAGGVTTYTYNVDGTRATAEDPAGNVTTFAYDALRRLTRVTHDDGSYREFAYDAHDNVLTSFDELGQTTAFTYDTNDNLVTVTDASGGVTTLVYDDMDRVTAIEDDAGRTTVYAYDPRGRLLSVSDPGGGVTGYTYDALGRLAAITDQEGRTWSRTLTAEGVIASASDPLGNVTLFDSDSSGRLLGMTTPRGHASTLVRDGMGRVTEGIDELGGTTALTRDAAGLLTGVTLPDPAVAAGYQRDALGLVTQVTDAGGQPWRRDRDDAGRITAFVDPLDNTTGIGYDNRNRASLITFPGALGTATYGYDDAGRVTSIDFSDGTAFTFTYDALHRLTAATGIDLDYATNTRHLVASNGIAVARDSRGRIAAMTLAPGRTVTYTYDASHRVTQVVDWTSNATDLVYDTAGRLASVSRPNGIVTHYGYDANGRVASVVEEGPAGPVSSIALQRDPLGRIASALRDVPLPAALAVTETVETVFDAASQATGQVHDAEGKLIDDGTREYTWNLASQLVALTGSDAATFTYDAFGGRLTRASGGTTRSYAWNYALRLPGVSVVREEGDDLRYHVHTPDGLLLYTVEAAGDVRRDFHYDELGNTLFLSAADGTITDRYAYTPYGVLLARTGGSDNPYTWQGRHGFEREGADGLYYARARYYDSRTTRFLSRDPALLATPKEVNPYQYASLNPLLFNDPTGREPQAVDKPEEPEEFDISSVMTVCGSGTTEDPFVLTEEEFTRIMNAEIVSDVFDKAQNSSLGNYDPQIPMTLDSPFVSTRGGLQMKQFRFRGRTMIGGDLNYYLQGWYWAHIGMPRGAMLEIIRSYKQRKYNCDPTDDAIFAALEGYNDRAAGPDEVINSGYDFVTTPSFNNPVVGGILSVAVPKLIQGVTNIFTPAGKGN